MNKKISVLEMVLLLMLVLAGLCVIIYVVNVVDKVNLSLDEIDVKYLVYVVSSDEPIHVDRMRVGYENGVLVVTMMNGVKIRLSPHEWKRVVEVLE